MEESQRDAGLHSKREVARGSGHRAVSRLISLRMTVAMASVTVLGGLLLVLGVLLGSRHELSERGLNADLDASAAYGAGMLVIDTRKALAFTVLFVIGVIVSVGVIGWFYTRREVEPLERAFTLQKHFVADASHELKTPLAVISTRIDWLEFRARRDQPIDEPLAALRGDVDRMDAIINDLLIAAQGAVIREPVDMVDVVGRSIDAVDALARSHGVALASRIEGEHGRFIVNGNAVGLSRCLVAVLDNAIAHSNSGDEVLVSMTAARRRSGGFVAIRVRDHGSGIGGDPERLFSRFARDDDGTQHQGYGLGLALARDMAMRYGGDIRVERSSSQGTVMLLTLPLSRNP